MKGVSGKLIDIFIAFLKIGPVTFGGGYAMIPLIEREVVTNKKWLKMEEVSEVFALAESVPGAIAINSATFIGHRVAGIPGAIMAMLGVLIPTFATVLGLSFLYLTFQGNPLMESFFLGVRPAIVALIVYAGLKISKTAIFDRATAVIFIVMLCMLLFTALHPIFFIIIGILLGVLFQKIKSVKEFVQN